MKRKHILAIAITTCLLFIAGILVWFELSREEAAQTKPEVESKVTPKPSLESELEAKGEKDIQIVEKKNCSINGREYKSLRYVKQKGEIVLIDAIVEGDSLVVPNAVDGVKIERIGLSYDQISEATQYGGSWTGMTKKFMEVIIPEGVKVIEERAFYGLWAEKVVLPSTLEKIGSFAFVGEECSKIEKIIVKGKSVDIGLAAFSEQKELEEISFPKRYQGSFANCFSYSSIKQICWPEGGRVDAGTFFGCKELEKVNFPENQEVIKIPECCFVGCKKLKELVFPESTGKVIIENTISAENALRSSVPILRFEGENTKLEGLKEKVKGKDLVMAQKIIAPKGSEAIKYAKKAYRLK